MFVGIDVSKERLDVSVRPTGERFVVTREETGLADLVKRLQTAKPELVVLEATGGYEQVVLAVKAASPADGRACAACSTWPRSPPCASIR